MCRTLSIDCVSSSTGSNLETVNELRILDRIRLQRSNLRKLAAGQVGKQRVANSTHGRVRASRSSG